MANAHLTNTIILAASKFNPKDIAAQLITDPGLLPIHGKPAIGWCLDSVLRNGAKNIKIILRENSQRLNKFLDFSFPEVARYCLGEKDCFFQLLASVLDDCDETYPTQIIYADTLINETFPEEDNVFLTSTEIKTSKPWCLVERDAQDHIKCICNKVPDLSINNKEALIGYYKFSDTLLLKQLLFQAAQQNSPKIEQILFEYNKCHPILLKTTHNWFDFGHISGAVKAKRELFVAREFNTIKSDPLFGTLTKTSKKKQKLLDEAYWYCSLPKKLSILAPRVLNIEEEKEVVRIEMEMYGYPNLAEIFVYGSNNLEDWCNIIESLFKVHKALEEYTEPVNTKELIEIYQTKTIQRIVDIETYDKEISTIMTGNDIIINNVKYHNFSVLREMLGCEIEHLITYPRKTIVHGDYCLSNILFDPTNYIFKLIDPRGRFEKQSIYGDPRYDIAKLRHSIVGLYDFIIAGLYKIEKLSEGIYNFEIAAPRAFEPLRVYFDNLMVAYGYDPREIKIIEALLFLTMIPLHRDDIQRQKAFYLTAIKKLNEVLYEK